MTCVASLAREVLVAWSLTSADRACVDMYRAHVINVRHVCSDCPVLAGSAADDARFLQGGMHIDFLVRGRSLAAWHVLTAAPPLSSSSANAQ